MEPKGACDTKRAKVTMGSVRFPTGISSSGAHSLHFLHDWSQSGKPTWKWKTHQLNPMELIVEMHFLLNLRNSSYLLLFETNRLSGPQNAGCGRFGAWLGHLDCKILSRFHWEMEGNTFQSFPRFPTLYQQAQHHVECGIAERRGNAAWNSQAYEIPYAWMW